MLRFIRQARLLFKARYLIPCSLCGLNTKASRTEVDVFWLTLIQLRLSLAEPLMDESKLQIRFDFAEGGGECQQARDGGGGGLTYCL